jgi:hypothetical protein
MSEYCQPVPRSVLFPALRARIRELREAGEKLPLKLCAASYLFDLQSKKGEEGIKTQAEYARMWGWSTSWVADHIDEIREEALAQADFYSSVRTSEEARRDATDAENSRGLRSDEGRTPNGRRADADPPAEDAEAEKSEGRGRRADEERMMRGRRKDTNISDYSDCQTSSSSASARAREDDPPSTTSSPPAQPPDLDFLATDDAPYRAGVEYAIGQAGNDLEDPKRLAALWEKQWGRQQPAKPYELEEILAPYRGDYSAKAVIAAIVISSDTENPNRRFFNAILRRLHAQEQAIQQGKSPDAAYRDWKSNQGADGGGGSRRRGDGGSRGSGGPPGRTANRTRGAYQEPA